MTHPSSPTSRADKLRKLIDQPFVGFAPWVMLSVVEGPHRLVLAAALAFGLAAATTVIGALLGQRPKILDIVGLIFFAALMTLATVADSGTSAWLGNWAAELSNVAIAVIAGVSLAARRPFTIQYARESTPREYWTSPLFLRINYVITAVWAVVFALIAVVGYIGIGLLHEPNNLWTSWIVQIALIVMAVKFTAWYPDYATAEPRPASGGRGRSADHADLLRPLAAYLIPVGIIVIIIAGSAWWAGAALIVVGVIATRKLHQATRVARTGSAPQDPNPS